MGLEYRITEGNYRRHLKWRGGRALCCFRCGGKISPGDWIHKNNSSSIKGEARFYHLSCFEEMFVCVG